MFYTLGLLCLFYRATVQALIKKIDGMSKDIKEVETVCVGPQQAGSWTKKDNPIHFRWTAPLIFHTKKRNVMHHQSIHPPRWYESKMETNYKYPSEPKTNPRCLRSVSQPVEVSRLMYKLHASTCEKYLKF